MTTPTTISDADARARYRAVVARVDALRRRNQAVERGERVEGWPRPLSTAGLRLLRRVRCGAVRQLRALGDEKEN